MIIEIVLRDIYASCCQMVSKDSALSCLREKNGNALYESEISVDD